MSASYLVCFLPVLEKTRAQGKPEIFKYISSVFDGSSLKHLDDFSVPLSYKYKSFF